MYLFWLCISKQYPFLLIIWILNYPDYLWWSLQVWRIEVSLHKNGSMCYFKLKLINFLSLWQSVGLFDWTQGHLLCRWTGHTRDVTKVRVYFIQIQTHVIITSISYWWSLLWVDRQGTAESKTIAHTKTRISTKDLIILNGKQPCSEHGLVWVRVCSAPPAGPTQKFTEYLPGVHLILVLPNFIPKYMYRYLP